jgi:hypothetical protein
MSIEELQAENERLRNQIENLRSVMVRAAEEIAKHWQAHCDKDNLGPVNLLRRLEEGIPSEYAYKAGDFARLRNRERALLHDINQRDADIARLNAELERLRGVVPPNEHGTNRYGLDMAYFRNVINRDLNRPLVDHRPSDFARMLARMSRTADENVMYEPEFQRLRGGGEAVRCVLCGGDGHHPEPIGLSPICCRNPDGNECCGNPDSEPVWGPCMQCKGSGVVYTHPAPAHPKATIDVVAELQQNLAERDKRISELKKFVKEQSAILNDKIVSEQAAYIEWQHGKGAEAGMQWIANGLWGPGLIPEESEPWGTEAQAYYDANKSNPFPECFCGRPSNQLWMGKGACCDGHMTQIRQRHSILSTPQPEAPK